MYFLCTGIESLEVQLEGEGFHRIFAGSVLPSVVSEFLKQGHLIEGVVISPHLPNYEDMMEDVVIPLRRKNIRIVFLPGSPTGKDTKEWIDKMTSWGVYDYVYDPVKPKDILYRLDHPSSMEDIPLLAAEAANKRIVDVEMPEPPPDEKESILKKLFGKTAKPPLAHPSANTYTPPVVEAEASVVTESDPEPINEPATNPSLLPAVISQPKEERFWFQRKTQEPKPREEEKGSLLSNLLTNKKQGIVIDGKFIPEKFDNPLTMIDKYQGKPLEAVVVSVASDPVHIKMFRRDMRTRNIAMVVTKGDETHLKLGADKCVKKINKAALKEISAYTRQLRRLWESAQYDKLTGAYTRDFFQTWLKEQENNSRKFTIVFIDPDHFKNINDTYGHEAGDDVLIQFASFLKTSVRENDIVVRWGGDEFLIAMPNTIYENAYIIMDRLCQRWATTDVYAAGNKIQCTFSAGVAESGPGIDVVKVADQLMYDAKHEGRNRVKAKKHAQTVFLMGNIPDAPFIEAGLGIAGDTTGADYVICTNDDLKRVPANRTPYVICASQMAVWGIMRDRPEALVYSSITELLDFINQNSLVKTGASPQNVSVVTPAPSVEPAPGTGPVARLAPESPVVAAVTSEPAPVVSKEPGILRHQVPRPVAPTKPINEELSGRRHNSSQPSKAPITVLPGARGSGGNQTIPLHGALYVVCPSKPGLAGEIAVRLAKAATKAALVCAAPEATAAIELRMPSEVLILQDWRMPRSEAPVEWQGLSVWPIDPFKHINVASVYDVHTLVDQIKSYFDIVIVDCAGSLSFCSRTARDEGILVLRKEGDSSDKATDHWVRNNDYHNVLTLSPSDVPDIIAAENGFIIGRAQWTGFNEQFNQ